jgi:hypothetical protein
MKAKARGPERDKYVRGPGKPQSRELPERVKEMQTFLVRVIRYDRMGLNQRAIAYAIWHEYEQAHIRRQRRSRREKPPGNLIPRFATRFDLDAVRADCERYLREVGGGRAPRNEEIAREVAGRFTEAEARSAVRKIQRLVAEAKTYEYRHIGSDHITGRKPLPPPRRG